MCEDKEALITESKNLELGKPKEEWILVWNRQLEANFVLVLICINFHVIYYH